MNCTAFTRLRFCLLALLMGLGVLLAPTKAWSQSPAAAPVVSFEAGATPTQFNALITSETSGAVIKYTIDGVDPMVSGLPVGGTGLVAISTNVILRARAWDGTNAASWSPLTTVVFNAYGKVASGDDDTILLKADGRVWASGSNTTGQLGIGTVAANSLVPVPVVRIFGRSAAGCRFDRRWNERR